MATTITTVTTIADMCITMPDDIPGLQLWLDADDPTTLFQDSALTTPADEDNDPVGGWKDKSGNNKHALQETAGYKPILKLDIRNGKPVVRCDGIDDRLDFTATALTDYTIYVAFNRTHNVSSGIDFILSGATDQGIYGGGAGSTRYIGSRDTVVNERESTYKPTTFNVLCWENDKLWCNGAEMVYDTEQTIAGLTLSRIANSVAYVGDALEGDIAEILVYNTLHDNATRINIERYLGYKWGVKTLGMSYSLPPVGPGLVLVFDDEQRNTWYGFRYWQARGLVATIYTTTDWIGTTEEFLTSGELQIMDAAGWLIGNHTKTHTDLTTLSEAAQETEMSAADAALTAISLSSGNHHLAFPYGARNADTVTAMTATGMVTGRATNNPVYIDPATWSPIDFGLALYGANTDTLADIKTVISTAIAQGKYAVILFHGIGGGSDEMSGEALMEQLADWLVEQDIPCLTVADLYAL